MTTHSGLGLALRGIGETLISLASGIKDEPSAPTAAPEAEGTLLGRKGLAKALGVSLATIDRACTTGLPYELVGTRRRFEIASVRAWFAARGKTPTTPEARDPEIDRIARRSGLRVAR